MANSPPVFEEKDQQIVNFDWRPPARPSLVAMIKREEFKFTSVKIEERKFPETEKKNNQEVIDDRRRFFLKLVAGTGLGLFAATVLPKRASALVMGGTPTNSVIGLKNDANVRVNPATEETLVSTINGLEILKKSVYLTGTGTIHTPDTGKKVRIYNNKFSLTADLTSVAFSFGSGGTVFEKYLAPKSGGLYGANNQPNYVEGEINEAFYCTIVGTGNIQVNFDYLEI